MRVVRSAVVVGSAYLENLGILLAPFAVLALALMERREWSGACLVLGATLLVKPALVPLFAVPLTMGVWRPVAITAVLVVAVVAVCAALVPGGWHVVDLPSRLAADPASYGLPAFDNLALSSVASQHGVPVAPVYVVRIVVALITVAACVRTWQQRDSTGKVVTLGYLVLLAFLLAGKLYEPDYALLLCGAPFVAWRTGEKWASGLILVGTVALFAPPQTLPSARAQDALFWVAGTLLMFAGMAWACLLGRARLTGRLCGLGPRIRELPAAESAEGLGRVT